MVIPVAYGLNYGLRWSLIIAKSFPRNQWQAESARWPRWGQTPGPDECQAVARRGWFWFQAQSLFDLADSTLDLGIRPASTPGTFDQITRTVAVGEAEDT
jgi:hypothetical protein